MTRSKGLSARRGKGPRLRVAPFCLQLRRKCLGGSIHADLGQVKATLSVLVQSGRRCAHLSHCLTTVLHCSSRATPPDPPLGHPGLIPPEGNCAFLVLEKNRVMGFQTRPGAEARICPHVAPGCSRTARSCVMHHPPQLMDPLPTAPLKSSPGSPIKAWERGQAWFAAVTSSSSTFSLFLEQNGASTWQIKRTTLCTVGTQEPSRAS